MKLRFLALTAGLLTLGAAAPALAADKFAYVDMQQALGESEAYRTPPVYDPKAMMHDRVIIGAYSTAEEDSLPRGRTRVARVHVRVEGPAGFEPEFAVVLETAGTAHGARIAGEVTIEKGERP